MPKKKAKKKPIYRPTLDEIAEGTAAIRAGWPTRRNISRRPRQPSIKVVPTGSGQRRKGTLFLDDELIDFGDE